MHFFFNRLHAKKNLIAKIRFLNEFSLCLMDSDDINDVSDKVDEAIKCVKKLLASSGHGLLIPQKRKNMHDLRGKIKEKGNIITQEE